MWVNNEGFGIIEYSEAFIDGKRKQGMAECDIVHTYIRTLWKRQTGHQVDMPPALDIEVVSEIKEYGKEFLVEKTLQWLRKIESTMHVRPII